MLSEREARVFRDMANLATLKGCHTLAAMALNELDRLGGKNMLTRDEHVLVYEQEQAAIDAACTRSS